MLTSCLVLLFLFEIFLNVVNIYGVKQVEVNQGEQQVRVFDVTKIPVCNKNHCIKGNENTKLIALLSPL
jgi:metal-sulfur cluster biosynthetic enzyme